MEDERYQQGPTLRTARRLLYTLIERLLRESVGRGDDFGYVTWIFDLTDDRLSYVLYHPPGEPSVPVRPRYGIPARDEHMEVRSRWFDCAETGELLSWGIR